MLVLDSFRLAKTKSDPYYIFPKSTPPKKSLGHTKKKKKIVDLLKFFFDRNEKKSNFGPNLKKNIGTPPKKN